MKKKMKKIFKALVVLFLVAVIIAVSVNLYVCLSVDSRIYNEKNYELSGEYDAIIVLGCGVLPDGVPTRMMVDRLNTAINLYNSGVCKTLLLSGDHGRDGYDEVKMLLDHVKPALRGYDDFKEYLLDLAVDYDIHFVVTSRRNAIEKPDAQKMTGDAFEFSVLSYEEQKDWCLQRPEHHAYWNDTLDDICKGFHQDGYKKNLYELLQIPFVFRMVVHQEYKIDGHVANRAGLYEDLFRSTMTKHKMEEDEIESLEKEYQKLAYDIWCNDEDVAIRSGKSRDLLLFSYYTKAESGKQSKEIGFIHKSFYEYYLALFFYNQLKEVKEGREESYLELLAERWLDPGKDILAFFAEIAGNRQEEVMIKKASAVLKCADRTECIIPVKNEVRGNADKSPFERCNNIFRNVISICLMFDVVEIFNQSHNIIGLLNKFKSSGLVMVTKSYGRRVSNDKAILLSHKDLTEADFSYADLSGVDFSDSKLKRVDLIEANLKGANLSGTKLLKARLNRVNLENANMSRADLSGANLSEANLKYAKMNEVCLDEAFLVSANLENTEFRDVYLIRTNLSGAKLTGADMNGAKFIKSNLIGAKLNHVKMSNANLDNTKLMYADFSEACLDGTKFYQVDMSGIHVSRKALSKRKKNSPPKRPKTLTTEP